MWPKSLTASPRWRANPNFWWRSPYGTQHSPNCDHVVIWNFTLDLLLLNLSLIHCVCNFFSFLVHFVPNIPDDHMITIWTMLRVVGAENSGFEVPAGAGCPLIRSSLWFETAIAGIWGPYLHLQANVAHDSRIRGVTNSKCIFCNGYTAIGSYTWDPLN